MELTLPAGKSVASNTAPKPQDKPQSKVNGAGRYVVKSGDTLSKIASRELGSAERWTEIRDLNPGINPNALQVGAKLTLPAAGAVVAKATPKSESTVGWGPTSSGKKSRVQ